MPEVNHIDAKSGDVLLMVGTMKGAFLVSSSAGRQDWTVGGPYFPGRAIYAFAHDQRNGRNRLWAAVNSSFWGSYLSTSDSFGREWTEPEAYNIKFPEDSETSLKQIWQIEEGHEDDTNTLFCGVEPAALFRSDDAGASWSLVKGLFDHPHRTQWQPGGGGLCLHTILPDPSNKDRMHHRNLHRRGLSHRRRWQELERSQRRRARAVSAAGTPLSGVWTVCSQDREPSFESRSIVFAEPLGTLSQRRCGGLLDRHRERRAFRFWFRDAGRSE